MRSSFSAVPASTIWKSASPRGQAPNTYLAVLLDVSLQADERCAEALAEALLEAGALSVTVEDALGGTEEETPLFREPGSGPAALAWRSSRLRVLVDGEREAAERLIEAACDSLKLPAIPIATWVGGADVDWARQE